MRKWLWLVALLASQAYAQEFTDAEVLNVETKQGFTNGIFNPAVKADEYTEVTLQIGDMKVTARTNPGGIGGGIVYLANHPEAMIVGSTVQAQIAKSWLQVQVPPKGKVLKFKIERLEKIAN
jgi:hypothetical protein